jgi:peptidoglycan/LPS O-acetylase OafA/YrhL
MDYTQSFSKNQARRQAQIIKKIRSPEIDILRGFAILNVVLIHSVGGYVAAIYPQHVYSQWPYWLRFLQSFITSAVPTFMFASGFVYGLDNALTSFSTLKSFVAKRAKRLLVPCMVFSIIYILLRVIADKISPIQLNYSYDTSAWNFVLMFLGIGSPAPHLYFLVLLFIIGVLFAFLDLFTRPLRFKVVVLGLISFIIFGLALILKPPFPLNYLRDYLTYMLVYYLSWVAAFVFQRNKLFKTNFVAPTTIFFGVIFALCVFTGNPDLHNILTVALAQITPFVILFLCHWMWRDWHKLSNFYIWIGGYSMSIYLLHDPFGTSMINALLYRGLKIHSFFLGFFVSTFFPIMISILIANLLSKTPIYEVVFGQKFYKRELTGLPLESGRPA